MKVNQWVAVAGAASASALALATGAAAGQPQPFSFTATITSITFASSRSDGPNTVYEIVQNRVLAGDITGTAELTIRYTVHGDGSATFQGYMTANPDTVTPCGTGAFVTRFTGSGDNTTLTFTSHLTTIDDATDTAAIHFVGDNSEVIPVASITGTYDCH
jgi:hypothetical protein